MLGRHHGGHRRASAFTTALSPARDRHRSGHIATGRIPHSGSRSHSAFGIGALVFGNSRFIRLSVQATPIIPRLRSLRRSGGITLPGHSANSPLTAIAMARTAAHIAAFIQARSASFAITLPFRITALITLGCRQFLSIPAFQSSWPGRFIRRHYFRCRITGRPAGTPPGQDRRPRVGPLPILLIRIPSPVIQGSTPPCASSARHSRPVQPLPLAISGLRLAGSVAGVALYIIIRAS